jgi:hypothetical protein
MNRLLSEINNRAKSHREIKGATQYHNIYSSVGSTE